MGAVITRSVSPGQQILSGPSLRSVKRSPFKHGRLLHPTMSSIPAISESLLEEMAKIARLGEFESRLSNPHIWSFIFGYGACRSRSWTVVLLGYSTTAWRRNSGQE